MGGRDAPNQMDSREAANLNGVSMDRSSLEELLTPVSAGNGDPSAYPVRVALLADGVRPTAPDWHTATWTTQDGVHYAVLLVGPGGVVTPQPGVYRTWTEITAAPEKPVVVSARFQIT